MTDGNKTVRVELAERSYDIVIGTSLLAHAGEAIKDATGANKAFIVTDTTVGPLYLDALRASLASAGIAAHHHVLPAGESTKNFSQLETVVSTALDAEIERSDVFVALGGGVIGDLTGFAASILRRGVRFVQIPTTLLAQVDSSVGGKTAINMHQGKNLVGTFHQPSLVLADTEVLKSLPEREYLAGYAEVIKYGLINDSDFVEWLETNANRTLARDEEACSYMIEKSCAAKARIVESDEKEAGDRALLNLGHTFGHALETATGYSDRLLHGEGVAIGCALAYQFSHELGLCRKEDSDRVVSLLKTSRLIHDMSDIPGPPLQAKDLVTAMRQDKKASQGKPTFILTRGLGQAFVSRDVTLEQVEAFLDSTLAS